MQNRTLPSAFHTIITLEAHSDCAGSIKFAFNMASICAHHRSGEIEHLLSLGQQRRRSDDVYISSARIRDDHTSNMNPEDRNVA